MGGKRVRIMSFLHRVAATSVIATIFAAKEKDHMSTIEAMMPGSTSKRLEGQGIRKCSYI